MERRRALVLAGAITVAVGASTVALAATGTVAVLGFGSSSHAHHAPAATPTRAGGITVVTRKHDVYDKFVVSVPTSAPVHSGSEPAAHAPAVAFIPIGNIIPVAPVTAKPSPTTTPPAPEPGNAKEPVVTTPTTSAPTPRTTTTFAPTTTVPCHHRSCNPSDDPPGDD